MICSALRAVMATKFGRLVGGAGGEHVGRANDGGLTALAYVGLDWLACAEIGVLHASHGVHGVHQREAVTALEL